MTLKSKFQEQHNKGKAADDPERYTTAGQSRYLSFILPSGESLALNYAYLISIKCTPDADRIELAYTTHTIELTGRNLAPLFDSLTIQLPRKITCTDERYLATKEDGESVVVGIRVAGKE